MTLYLTKIELLDQQFTGLEEDVRSWLRQGVSSAKIAPLIQEKYQVCVPAGVIGRFRAQRWVPDQMRLREKKLDALVAFEVTQERAIKASLAAGNPGDLK